MSQEKFSLAASPGPFSPGSCQGSALLRQRDDGGDDAAGHHHTPLEPTAAGAESRIWAVPQLKRILHAAG